MARGNDAKLGRSLKLSEKEIIWTERGTIFCNSTRKSYKVSDLGRA